MSDLLPWLPTITVAVALGGLVWRASSTLTRLEHELAALRGQHVALASEIDALRALLVVAIRPNGNPTP